MKYFRNRPIRNKNCLWQPCLLTDRDEMSNLYRAYMFPNKFRFIWLSSFREEDFQKSTNLKQELPWWPCLLTDQNEMSNLYRGPSIDASYQVSFHLATRFQRKSFFRNRPIRNKNCLWQSCLLSNLDPYKFSGLRPLG